jgi:hypothetical protein
MSPSSDRPKRSIVVKKDSVTEEVPSTSNDYKAHFKKVVNDATTFVNKNVDRNVTADEVNQRFGNLRILRRERVYLDTEERQGYQYTYILGTENFRSTLDVARFVFDIKDKEEKKAGQSPRVTKKRKVVDDAELEALISTGSGKKKLKLDMSEEIEDVASKGYGSGSGLPVKKLDLDMSKEIVAVATKGSSGSGSGLPCKKLNLDMSMEVVDVASKGSGSGSGSGSGKEVATKGSGKTKLNFDMSKEVMAVADIGAMFSKGSNKGSGSGKKSIDEQEDNNNSFVPPPPPPPPPPLAMSDMDTAQMLASRGLSAICRVFE